MLAVASRRCSQSLSQLCSSPSTFFALVERAQESVRSATVTHPVTGEPVWFNFVHLFRLNVRGLGWWRYLLSRLFFLRRETRTQDAHYGDGGEIDLASIARIFEAMEAETVVVPWEPGDVLWIDNLLCRHGRNPFRGPRRILAATTR